MIVGTETEYGISAPGRGDADPHVLSALVVDACDVPATPAVSEIHNRMLANGARFYVDHAHPEYATPECTSARDALAWEAAGDRIVERAAAAASGVFGSPIAVFKNNTDGKGASYGYHENHLLRRETPWSRVLAHLPAFLVTRILFTGAGRVGVGTHGERPDAFQLSQRADFFEQLTSLDTTRARGLVNTRDEPHANPARWRRLHVITGDATRHPYATWLKIGTLQVVLAALEADVLPTVTLADPVDAFRAVSRDLSLRRPLELADGARESALGVQERFLDACATASGRLDVPDLDALLAAWGSVLADLRRDPASTADRLDWTAKLRVCHGLAARHGVGLADPRVARLDLAWAQLGPVSPFAALQHAGGVRTPLPEVAAVDAERWPPRDTRAWLRGRWIAEQPRAVVAVTWDSLLVRDQRGALHTLKLPEPGQADEQRFEAGAGLARLLWLSESSAKETP